MQTFGMIVSAEPYFAVTQPGDTVVLENADTGGESIEARYELLARGAYSSSNTKIENAIFGIDRKTPLAKHNPPLRTTMPKAASVIAASSRSSMATPSASPHLSPPPLQLRESFTATQTQKVPCPRPPRHIAFHQPRRSSVTNTLTRRTENATALFRWPHPTQ
jgi:hypothetical protein